MKVTLAPGYIEVTAVLRDREDVNDLLKMLQVAAPWLPCRQPPKWLGQLRGHIDAGDKIPAIKLWRAVAHDGLKEAKDYVEGLASGSIQWPTGREYPDPPESFQ